MKKPLLLLVDDDPTILAALEAELAPEFTQLCRIEAFDDPRLVLEAIQGWAAEERLVAIAVVDQKMPDMSGAELLAKLCDLTAGASPDSFVPTGSMQALMLTGYAGVDSALAAKNLGGVYRYVEKPWKPAQLARDIREALAVFADKAGANRYFEFRELRSGDELLGSLRLRREVYAREPALSKLLPRDCPEPFDADPYDRFARHFGLFERVETSEAMRGSIRCAQSSEGPFARDLEGRFPAGTPLGGHIREPRDGPLPLLHYIVHRSAIETLLESISQAGEAVVEPSRLVLLPEHRAGGGRSERFLARHMIEAVVAYFFFFRTQNAVLTCAPAHVPFYRPFGFVEAEGTETVFTPFFGVLWTCLHGQPKRVAEDARRRCGEIAQRVAWNGGGCRCDNFPACLGGPYGTGDFFAVDLWCPALARRRLVEPEVTDA